MKNIIGILFLTMIFISCDEDLDINTNPNTPTNVDKSFILTAAQGSIVTVTGGVMTNLGGFFAQYHTQPPSAAQYLAIDTYNVNTDFANRLWSEIYAGALNDLEFVITQSELEGDTGSLLIASLLKVYTFQVMTDLFGAIPYSEALLGQGNISPKPDAGGDVYTGLIAVLDNAMATYNNNPVDSSVGAQDAIYAANMSDWIQFGNTLKLKLYLRMAYTSQANSAAVLSLLAKDNFITSDAKFDLYADEQNKANPFYDVQIDRLGDVNNIASSSLMSFYKENADPRISAVYRLSNTDVYRSIDQGDRGNYLNEVAADFSKPNITATTPVYFMSVSESNFLQAEAIIRYGNGANAQSKYNAGIINSFIAYGSDLAMAQTLIGAGGAYEYSSTGNVETDLRQVMVQKWASLAYINTIEGFFEVNRTKYPETVTKGNENYAIGNFVVSLGSVLPGNETPNTIFYADNEVTRNKNLDQKTSIIEKIWWDQKN